MLAVGGRCTPERAVRSLAEPNEVAPGSTRPGRRVVISCSNQTLPSGSLNEAREEVAALGIQTADPAIGADVKELAHPDAGGDQLVPGGYNVGNDQLSLG